MDPSRIFIVGANGQLGLALQAKYPEAKKADIDEMDITNRESVLGYDWSGIDVILNAAAFTNVDGAETAEGRVAAWKVNASAVGYLAQVANQHDITLVHISTEYVFDGTNEPHAEDEPLSPLGVYAQSKAAAEVVVGVVPKHYICRTSWLIGEGKNFVRTMMGLADKGISPTVVSDQVGRLTFTPTLVDSIDKLLTGKAPFGTYNVTNDGEPASWADVARLIFEYMDRTDISVTGTSTKDYYQSKPESAPRPLKSIMDLSKIKSAGVELPDWREDLKQYVTNEMSKEQDQS